MIFFALSRFLLNFVPAFPPRVPASVGGRYGGRPPRGVAQLASASGLGPEGRVFESHHPDETKEADSLESWPLFEGIPFALFLIFVL